jgi:Putative Flp pilus-assembly TadE/G-like
MKTAPSTSGKPRRGQTLIFMLMLMIILTFVAFSVYDTQHVVVQRVRTQIASDAAALTGARWQAASLNAIGEINLLKVTTQIVTSGPQPFGGVEGNYAQYQPLFSALDKLQARLAITGPMMGVLYAEQAAKLNGMHSIPAFGTLFANIAEFVQLSDGNPSIVNDPWLWWPVFDPNNKTDMEERRQLLMDYAALCQEIADEGVAALPNMWGNSDRVPDLMDWSHATPYAREYLANRMFYAAIAGQDWCFLKPLLWIYTDWTFWGPVIVGNADNGFDPFMILNLQLSPQADPFMGRPVGSFDTATLDALHAAVQSQLKRRPELTANPNWPDGGNWPLYGFQFTNDLPRFDDSSAPAYVPLRWAIYKQGWYNQWNPATVGQYLKGTVKAQCNYSYQNVDSVWMSQAAASVTMAVPNFNQSSNQTAWTAPRQRGELSEALGNLWALRGANALSGKGIVAVAAARSFGSIDNNTPPTGTMGLPIPIVLPVFKDVRLIPLVASSAGGNFDFEWVEHVVFHLPIYTQQGLANLPSSCPYCNDLVVWEDPAFRQIGQNWFASQPPDVDPCFNPGVGLPPGGGRGGGGGIVAH